MKPFDNLHEMLNKALRAAHGADLAEIEATNNDLAKGNVDKRGIKRVALTDPDLTSQYGGGGYGLYKPRFSHLSYKTLKEMSLRDPIVATIIQTRINQLVAFAKPQPSRYDTGFKILPVDPEMDIDKESEEEAEIKAITDYVCNTGVVDDNRQASDLMSFETWLKLVVRDRLTYGAVSLETIRDNSRRIYAFLPVPTETVFYANKAVDDESIKQLATMNKPTYATGAEREIIQEDMLERVQRGEIEYVQVVEGRVVEGFTREELIFKLGNPQNFIDSNGYCYVPGTPITLYDGTVKPIEEIEIGDRIIDHLGQTKEVSKLTNRGINEEIIRLEACGFTPFEVTGNHPVYAIKNKNFRFRVGKESPTFVRADELSSDSYLVVPKVEHIEKELVIDLLSLGNLQSINGLESAMVRASYNSRWQDRYVKINEDLCWLLGLYAGDGCIHGQNGLKVRFDLSNNETWIFDRIEEIAKQRDWFFRRTFSSDGRHTQVFLGDTVVAKLFSCLVPGKVHTKRFDERILSLPVACLKNLVLGYIEADGNYYRGCAKAVTVSENLAYQLQMISNKCGILVRVDKGRHRLIKSQEYGEHWDLSFPSIFDAWCDLLKGKKTFKGRNRMYLEDKDNFYIKVKKISRVSYSGIVHNFEVPNSHSYLAAGFATHNCLGELEMATTTITSHLQSDNYNKSYFTNGFAARGLLHIVGDVTPAQLQQFRSQWYNQIAGNSNSWRTPIIAGVDDVRWIQLSATNRDMEYTQYTDHLIRVLCGLFQISPLEIGMDHLIRGNSAGGLGESSNEWKIQESQDRGLRPLLVWIEAIINDDILPYAFPELEGKYKFCFVGLDAESKEQELERQKAELTLHTPIDDVRKELDKDPVLGGKVILNPDYIRFLLQTHKIGEIREMLLGYKGDLSNPEYNYIADPFFFNNKEMLMTQAAGVDAEGDPLPGAPGAVDEEGNPVGGAPPPDGGIQVAPEVEEAVELYVEEHPEIIEKALVKSADPAKVNTRFDKLRKQYMSVYKDVEKQMLKDVLNGIKEEVDHEEEETDGSTES